MWQHCQCATLQYAPLTLCSDWITVPVLTVQCLGDGLVACMATGNLEANDLCTTHPKIPCYFRCFVIPFPCVCLEPKARQFLLCDSLWTGNVASTTLQHKDMGRQCASWSWHEHATINWNLLQPHMWRFSEVDLACTSLYGGGMCSCQPIALPRHTWLM